MKNMKKFITLCGFLILESIACGDADVVKAEAINEQTTDTSGYTITIPSDVDIDKDSGNGSFAVTGKMDAQTKLDVTVNSQNGYKLKCGSKSIDYTLDKQSFHVDNIKSSNMKYFNENFDATLSYTDMNFSGSYKDKLTFNIESNVYIYKLDLNSILDGVNNYSVHDYGTADIYINGEKVADDVSDWGGTVHYEDTYEIKDIKGTTGHHYSGASDGENNLNNFPLKGKIGIDTKHVENSKGIFYSSIFLKFDTNTYTVKYDSNGGTGSMTDTVHKYYKSDKMDGVKKLRKNTFTRTGYQFQGWYLTRVINKETYYLYDNWQWYKEGTQPSGTKKCLYEDERRTSNATTVDKDVITAVAQWSPITYTIKYDGNGADGGVMENTTHIYHASSSESGVVQLRKNTFKKSGYSFSGWVFSKKINGEIYYIYNNWQWYKDNEQPSGVEKYIYKDEERSCNATTIDGDTITAIAQWEKAYSAGDTLDIEGTKYVVLEQKENNQALVMTADSIGQETFQSKFRSDGQNENTYEGSYIDNYLENDWYNSLSSTMKTAIRSTNIKQASYATPNAPDSKQETGYNGQVYNTISRHAFLPSVSELGKVVDFNNPDKVKAFTGGWDMWTRDSYQGSHNDVECLVPDNGGLLNGDAFSPYSVRPAFVVDLSQANYSVVIKGSTSGGTGGSGGSEGSGGTVTTPSELKVLDIEGTKYVVLEERENNQALVLTADSIGNKSFSRGYRDGVKQNTYEGSMIDNYLENEWYNGLSSIMKAAIQTTNIKQASYAIDTDPDSKQETDTNGQVYNTISRHVFLPSVSEIGKVVDLKNPDKVKAFLKGISIWTRDSNQGATSDAECLYASDGCLYGYKVRNAIGVRPSFVIDLSKVNYTVTGTVNYK